MTLFLVHYWKVFRLIFMKLILMVIENKLFKNKLKLAGAELCQAHIKLGQPASSFGLPFILFLQLKIGTQYFRNFSNILNFCFRFQISVSDFKFLFPSTGYGQGPWSFSSESMLNKTVTQVYTVPIMCYASMCPCPVLQCDPRVPCYCSMLPPSSIYLLLHAISKIQEGVVLLF